MKKVFTSIRTKLFLSLCIIVLSIITLLIILNNFVLEKFYLFNKESTLKTVCSIIDEFYSKSYSQSEINEELEKIAIKNDFDILIKNTNNENIYISNKDFYSGVIQMSKVIAPRNRNEYKVLQEGKNYIISEFQDQGTSIKYILISATLSNEYNVYIRMPITSIEESVKISNKFLYIIAVFVILFGGIIISIVSRRFSKPIEELETIAKGMSNLDFSQKYIPSEANDEIDNLGESINTLSKKLEGTIDQLRSANLELEKDVEEKSQIDEMRKSFISDVSHELKTPIALIQGYSEGLIENVNSDDENRRYYAEVILDEATKMDKLVKQLLELMKLEYGKNSFNNTEFNVIELEREILRKSKVMMEDIEVEFDNQYGEIQVFADDFYIEQIFTNYITNSIKYATEINGVKKIRIINEKKEDIGKVRITVFNTSEGLSEEELHRIWNRFYKIDESRNREKGGNGIGLSLVKAIMNNYGNAYGARNVAGGIEFYFELDLYK